MILKAKHNFIIHPFFKQFTFWKIKKAFESTRIVENFHDRNKPVLLLSNHISWWDGFWAMYLNLKVLKRKYHFMMLEDQLKKYWFFNYTGGFSVNKNSRSILESLDYAGSLLNYPENMVLIFPQGEIQSMHQQVFLFEKGIERIIKKAKVEIQILFMADFIDYFSSPKASLSMYLEEYEDGNYQIKNIEQAYNKFYQNCISQQIPN